MIETISLLRQYKNFKMEFPKNIYCIGIGGIGLSALAQYLQHDGHAVSGSDRSPSPVTELLEKRGITVHIGVNPENLKGIEYVIYSDAVPEENEEREEAKRLGILQVTYFEALGYVTEKKKTIAICGTHGKTTTTAMITKMLVDLGLKPSAIIGSLTKDFESNFVPGEGDLLVVEACEYRRHFHHIVPSVLVITNIELDHTDYYKDLPDVVDAFQVMASKVPPGGAIVANPNIESVALALLNQTASTVDYSKEYAPELRLIGEFNKMNARAAKAAVKAVVPEADEKRLDASLSDFKGTWRRFEFVGETKDGALVFDDYAHHPTAIRETLKAARARFPDKKIVVVFHPHLYSRTKSLFTEFATAFGDADGAIIAPIYAAREEEDPTISSKILAAKTQTRGGVAQAIDSFTTIGEELQKQAGIGDVIITMGAGDIYKVAEAITLG
jgi:UDP-N-acetylmuramate--alanine ligase